MGVLEQDLTPNVGGLLTNPVFAPLVRLIGLVFSAWVFYHLLIVMWHLIKTVSEQRKAGKPDSFHQPLVAPLLALGVLLLLVSGFGVYMVFGLVSGVAHLTGV